ncbi:hypothetical protein BC936DRAFT_139457 [Jimgerdemannia flammicorona]|uniref:HTH La-type RNA-binding domain-containing protein n=1 Tax=Jimgerdemannia flammicorona TaxID=994334 RepID=A0A433DHN3_9FUNG|nr:hypothetical protein BC936DRAFT_139457 [Jimgerdemannia flammicorona]
MRAPQEMTSQFPYATLSLLLFSFATMDPHPTPALLEQFQRSKKIASIVEGYFSDPNLLWDKLLLSKIEKDPEGFVDIVWLSKQSRLKPLKCGLQEIAEAAKTHSLTRLKLDEGRTRIARKKPYVKSKVSELDDWSIYVEGLHPPYHTIHTITDLFSPIGKVVFVRFPETKAKFLGFCFVEFDDATSVLRAVDWFNRFVVPPQPEVKVEGEGGEEKPDVEIGTTKAEEWEEELRNVAMEMEEEALPEVRMELYKEGVPPEVKESEAEGNRMLAVKKGSPKTVSSDGPTPTPEQRALADRLHLRVMTKRAWLALRDEYLAYLDACNAALMVKVEERRCAKEEKERTRQEERRAREEERHVKEIRAVYPIGVVAVATDVHPATNKLVLKKFFEQASLKVAYIDYTKNTTRVILLLPTISVDYGPFLLSDHVNPSDFVQCYVRFNTTQDATVATKYFSKGIVQRTQGDHEGATIEGLAGETDPLVMVRPAVSLRILEGKEEAIYWENLDVSITQQAKMKDGKHPATSAGKTGKPFVIVPVADMHGPEHLKGLPTSNAKHIRFTDTDGEDKASEPAGGVDEVSKRKAGAEVSGSPPLNKHIRFVEEKDVEGGKVSGIPKRKAREEAPGPLPASKHIKFEDSD